MDLSLSPVEIRVLGSLIEKQIATPEYYPLTLNALLNACNQTTNRDPVASYDASTVEHALESLRQDSLIWVVRGGRALKYEHRLNEKFKLGGREIATLCVLMLRGPQTAGEIRGRTGRLYEFTGLEEVESALESLMMAEPPLAMKLPRSPGTKEFRFAQLLGGAALIEENGATLGVEPATHPDDERVAQLEREIAAIRQELQELRQQFLDLKNQFE